MKIIKNATNIKENQHNIITMIIFMKWKHNAHTVMYVNTTQTHTLLQVSFRRTDWKTFTQIEK